MCAYGDRAKAEVGHGLGLQAPPALQPHTLHYIETVYELIVRNIRVVRGTGEPRVNIVEK